MNAIVDSNVATVLTALFLFQFGTGPVKGFAVTLIMGIAASMITAVFVTRTFYHDLAGPTASHVHPEHLTMTRFFANAKYDFIGVRKYAYALTAAIIIPGLVFLLVRGSTTASSSPAARCCRSARSRRWTPGRSGAPSTSRGFTGRRSSSSGRRTST